MNQRITLTLKGIISAVFPCTCCLWAGLGANLASPEGITHSILLFLPAMILIGASTGLGTSLIFPDWRVLVFGVAVGLVIGLIATGTFLNFLQVSFTDRDNPILLAIGVLVFGLLPGLLPAFLARRNQRT